MRFFASDFESQKFRVFENGFFQSIPETGVDFKSGYINSRMKSENLRSLNREGPKAHFQSQNAVDVIKAPAKKPIPKYVDTRGGHKSELIPSGLYPKV